MRRLVAITLALSVFLGGRAVSFASCGIDPADPAAVTAAETAIATQCDCCAPRRAYRACVTSVVKAARASALPARCVSKVRRDVAHACPLVPATITCRVCNADSDCATGEFCECRGGTCTKTGGVCVNRPQVCSDVVALVCGCDGTSYANDCLRQQAGACKLHDGPCVATGGCFDTIEGRCTGEPCSPSNGCPLPNELCDPHCLSLTCGTNADCDDGNPCTADQCVNGTCEHACVCVAPTGAVACCPGPGTLCAQPCGPSANGTCDGTCPVDTVCSAGATGCACVPKVRVCGDTFPTCDGSCPAGSACTSLTGAPACQCVPNACGACASCGAGSFFLTCGDPVCGGPRPHDGVPACTTQQPGDPCSCLGETCDPEDACNRLLECATSDPTHGGICPISRRAYKTNIEYLSAEDLTRLHDDLLKLRLASYQYAVPGASAATHLGFIIDDVAPSPSVAEGGDTVDLYGYASMAVAAVQTQAREIAALQREVEALRMQIKKCGSGGDAATAVAARQSQRARTSSKKGR